MNFFEELLKSIANELINIFRNAFVGTAVKAAISQDNFKLLSVSVEGRCLLGTHLSFSISLHISSSVARSTIQSCYCCFNFIIIIHFF